MPPSQRTEVDSLLTEYDDGDWSQAGGGLSHHTSYTQVDKTEVKQSERPLLYPKTEVLSRSQKHTANLTDNEDGMIYELKAMTTIGRAPDNNIVINEQSVSGHHAKIILQEDNFVLEEGKVTNPTLVNGQEIADHSHILTDGDEVTIGRKVLTFKQLS